MNPFRVSCFWHLCVYGLALVGSRLACAQIELWEKPLAPVEFPVDMSKPLSWQEACKLIGTQDRLLAQAIEESLRDALRLPERTEVIACALILHGVSQGNTDTVKSALAGTRSVFSEPSVETQNFIARARLWLWLTADDQNGANYAGSTFRELVRVTHSGTLPKAELRAHAQLIGTVCGMLQSKLAESPITLGDLRTAEECLTASPIAEVKSRFRQCQQIARQRAEALEQTIERVSTIAPHVLVDAQATRKAQLAELGFEFTSTRDPMIEIVRNSREVARQNTVGRRKLAALVSQMDRDWKNPTEGHPGQPPFEPRVPQKSSIRVDEYETKSDGYETKTDAEGNKYEVRKKKEVRRSTADIERERNQKYSHLLSQYNILKADYDQRIAIYVPLLNSWIEADRTRRVKMQAARAVALARSEELLATSKHFQQEAMSAKAEFRDQRSEVEILAERFELTDIAMQALNNQSFSAVFRPRYFELLDIEDEKFRLLGRIKK